MTKKLVLGVSAGRKMGNSEILLREALMGASEAGADIEMLRLNDFDIKYCKGCQSCTMKLNMKNEENLCIQKDDFPVFRDRLLACDAVIYSVPVFLIRPISSILTLADRIGPFHDIGGLESQGFKRPDSPIDQRLFKERCAGFISVGGAVRPQYASMGLTLMNDLTYPMNIKVVDQLMVLDSNGAGQVLKHKDKLERAHKLGKNVAENAGRKREDMEWCGDFDGTCPVCHGNLMTVENGEDEVTCAICGIRGKMKLDADNKMHVEFPRSEWEHSRLSKKECAYHYAEIGESLKNYFGMQGMIAENIGKYRDFDVKVISPNIAETKDE